MFCACIECNFLCFQESSVPKKSFLRASGICELHPEGETISRRSFVSLNSFCNNKTVFMGSSSVECDLEIQVDGMNRPGSDRNVVVDAYSELETRFVMFCSGGSCRFAGPRMTLS
jgi:hypothetical protein